MHVVYVLLLIALIFLLNNFIIKIFKIKNPNTKICIDFISFGACLSIFLMLPFKVLGNMFIVKNLDNFLMKTVGNDIYIEIPRNNALVEFSISDFFYLSSILLILAILFFSISVVLNKKIVKLYLKPRECEDERILKMVSEISKKLEIKKPKVMVYQGKLNACVYGFPPEIALSSEIFTKLNDDEINMILKHELHHIKNRDTILNLFLLSMRILLFYNPVVHLLHLRILRQREYLIDKMTAKTVKEKMILFSTMTKLNKNHTSSFFPTFATGNFSERFDVLLDSQKIKIAPIIISILITLSLIFSGIQYSKPKYFGESTNFFPEGFGEKDPLLMYDKYFINPTYLHYKGTPNFYIEDLEEIYPIKKARVPKKYEITIEEISPKRIILKFKDSEGEIDNLSIFKNRYQFYLEEDKEFLRIYKKSSFVSESRSRSYFDEEIAIILNNLKDEKIEATTNSNF